jgi:hypothetical protein
MDARVTWRVNNMLGIKIHKSRSFVIVGLCVSLLAVRSDAQSTDTNLGAVLKEFAVELKRLRLELLELRIEAQERIIPALQQQLRQLEHEQGRWQTNERTYQMQLAEIDQTLAVHNGDADERSQLSALRTAVAESTLGEVRAARVSVAQQQTELIRRLRIETEKLQALRQRAEKQ